MHQPRTVPDRRPPGPLPGAALGVAAGLLLGGVWDFGAWDVAVALSAVFAGLIIALGVGLPGWRPFGVAMLVGSMVSLGALLLLL